MQQGVKTQANLFKEAEDRLLGVGMEFSWDCLVLVEDEEKSHNLYLKKSVNVVGSAIIYQPFLLSQVSGCLRRLIEHSLS